MKHPLLNEDSKHYHAEEEPAILTLEKHFTLAQMLSWAEITALKYKLRENHKGQKENDIIKRQTFNDYADFLSKLYAKAERTSKTGKIAAHKINVLPLSQLYRDYKIELDYSI
jgi:hypothetical protein